MTGARVLLGLGALVGIGAGALLAAVVAAGLYLSRPAPAPIGPPPDSLPGGEMVAIASASGATLRGWWVPATVSGQDGAKRGGVVLMHGVRANRLQMLERARVLHDQGYAVLLFDFQAHGESTGARITFGKLESVDAAAAVQFMRARESRVAAIGVSLGGAAALVGVDPLAVDALVIESVYPDIGAALSNRLRVQLGPLGPVAAPALARVLAMVFQAVLPPILGVWTDELRPIDGVARVVAPVLIASGTADAYTPIGEAEALYARAVGSKQYWPVQGAGHVDLEYFDPAAYWAVVLPFLDQHLR